ncbi:mobile element transfer protein [Streptomyces sp. NPDC052415]|uniref:mobile element transfer protein n=1 Tax=Streptomyces sp. NPDC052415 TaxID=3365690 RepID=UPI0037D88F71
MSTNRRFRNVVRLGPVQVGTYYDGRGREKHTAACTAPRCGFSTDYDSRPAAELAARTHRCPVR